MAKSTSPAKAQSAGKAAMPTLVQVTDLTAGLDRRVAVTQMKPDRARRLRNVRVSVAGEWQPRPGWDDHSTTSLGSGRPQGAARVYLEGVTPFTLGAWDGKVYSITDAGVWGTADLSGLSTTEPIFFPYDAELVAVFDGTNVPKKSVDGTTWTQMGITPPAAPTVTATAGGSLVSGNEYEVVLVYRSALTTSNYGDSDTATPAGGDLTLTVACVASADSQVTAIDAYARDNDAGETVFRFAGTRANTNGNITITTNNWSAEEEAPSRRNVPPALAFGVPWKNRWWAVDAADRTRLRFTEIFENQSWPTLYFIDIPFTRGDEIAAVIPLGDVLVVFGKSKQAFLIIGQTSLDFEVRPSAAIEAGCLGPRAADIVENGIIHAAAQGVYLFDGAADRLLSHDFEGDWRSMIATSTATNIEQIPVIYHRRDKEFRIAVPTLPVYGTAGEWVLDLARTRVDDIPAWVTTDRTIGGYVQWDGNESTTGNQGRLFSWSNTIGRLYEESVGTSANGDDLTVDYEGPGFTSELRVARFIEAYVEFEQAEGDFTLDVTVDTLQVLSAPVDINGDFSEYGEAEYGNNVYGGATRAMRTIVLPLEAEGRAIQFSGEYVGQDAFKWYGYGFVMLPEPEIRGM